MQNFLHVTLSEVFMLSGMLFGFTGDFSELCNFVPDSGMESIILATSPFATTTYLTNIVNEKKELFWFTV